VVPLSKLPLGSRLACAAAWPGSWTRRAASAAAASTAALRTRSLMPSTWAGVCACCVSPRRSVSTGWDTWGFLFTRPLP